MATALNSIKNSSASSLRGYGGLASGLDRDTLIEGMTASTKAKIAKQQKKKQTYGWQQEAYRSISSKLVEFSKKYTSYTNQSTNLSSPSFWAKSNITPVGSNSSYVSVSGSSALSDTMSIVGVKQLAKNTSMASKTEVSDSSLITGSINLGESQVSNLEGQYVYFKVGSKSYSVSLKSGTTTDGYTYDYSNGKNAQESITRSLKEVSIGGGKTLADVIHVTADPYNAADPEGTPFKLNFKSTDTANNTILFDGGSETAIKALGFTNFDNLSEEERQIKPEGFTEDFMNKQKFFEPKTFAQRVGGMSMSFTYNGTTKSIEFDSAADIQTKIDAATGDEAKLKTIASQMQDKLNQQFGTGRIEVGTQKNPVAEGYQLVFKTKDASTGLDDTSSILSISYADNGVLGKNGAFRVSSGESNRLNTNATLADSGLKNIEQNLNTKGKLNQDTTYFAGSLKAQEAIKGLGDQVTNDTTLDELKQLIATKNPSMSDQDLSSINNAIDYFKSSESATNVGELNTKMNSYVDSREMKLKINGVDIKGLTYNSTITDIMNKINSSDAKVTMSYMKNADKFLIQSNVGGVAGDVKIEGDDAALLFGVKDTNYTVTKGQDAIVSVKYAGSEDVVHLTRESNAFSMDGLNITLNGTFGYSGDTLIEGTDPIKFNSKTDSDSIVKAVTDMIKDYNEMIELVNKEVSTKPNRSYEPLTDDQKADMTEDQIKKWEEKVKTGLLFNDSDLRGLADSMRFIFESGSEDKATLATFGLSTSTNYGDNGKLVLDETKFRASLESNSADLQKLFTRSADTSTGDKGGVMARLTEITEKYASTTGATKGILIEKAGSVYAPTSILKNSLQKSMDSQDTIIERLNAQLKTETDRYIKQFTNLETLISQMNSQSSWLSSSLGS
ncbi:flagellar filament capping protein FliD [Lacrimispora sp.]|uniref:flagellar filament capping protein FliD n=1 Tax=Lacrimispora sp. TaxID=2719234 RepID=UPI0032E47FD6